LSLDAAEGQYLMTPGNRNLLAAKLPVATDGVRADSSLKNVFRKAGFLAVFGGA